MEVIKMLCSQDNIVEIVIDFIIESIMILYRKVRKYLSPNRDNYIFYE